MPMEDKKGSVKHLLCASGRHPLKTFELEGGQANIKENAWNYNEFVANLLEIIVVLRIKDKLKNAPQEK